MSTSQTAPKRNIFLTILAWILAFLFIVSTIGVIFSFFPAGKLLNPDFYQQALVDVNIYQRLPTTIAMQLAENLTPAPGDSDSAISLMVLNEQDWETILVDLIDPGWLQSQSEQILDQFFEILLVSPDPANTPIEISVVEIKQNLAGPEGVQAINKIIAAQPPCSLEQLFGLMQVGLGMENSGASILCRPPEFILSEINPIVESLLSTTVGQLPDTIPLYIPFSLIENQTNETVLVSVPENIPGPLQTLRQVNTWVSWSPLLPIIFLILMTLVAVRSLRDFMAWWGSTLFTAGLISLIFSAILVPSAEWVLNSYLPLDLVSLISVPEILTQIGFTDLFQEMLNQLLMSIIIPAGTLAVIGFALLLGVFLLSRMSPNTKPQPVSAPIVNNPN